MQKQFVKVPWHPQYRNQVNTICVWPSMYFMLALPGGNIITTQQEMEYDPKTKTSTSKGTFANAKPRHGPELTYAEVEQIFDYSAKMKCSLTSAMLAVKGSGRFVQDDLEALKLPLNNEHHAWYPGCESDTAEPSAIEIPKEAAQPATSRGVKKNFVAAT